jgi:hypothetical protein
MAETVGGVSHRRLRQQPLVDQQPERGRGQGRARKARVAAGDAPLTATAAKAIGDSGLEEKP